MRLLKLVTPTLFAVTLSSHTAAADEDGSEAEAKIAQPAERPWRPPTLTSGLGVPAGETFHLGERPSGSFIVSAKNRGSVAATILATRDKRIETVGTVKPGETVVREFQSGDGVLVRNESLAVSAQLTVEVWGTKDLSMYYVSNDEEEKASE